MICVFRNISVVFFVYTFEGSKIKALIKEQDKIERNFMAERDKLVLELKKMKEDKVLQQRASEAREAQMKEEIKALLKENEEMMTVIEAERDSLPFQLEEAKLMTEELVRIQHIILEGSIKQCSGADGPWKGKYPNIADEMREVHMMEEIKHLPKQSNEMMKMFQAHSLAFQGEEVKSMVKDDIDEFKEADRKIILEACIKQCSGADEHWGGRHGK